MPKVAGVLIITTRPHSTSQPLATVYAPNGDHMLDSIIGRCHPEGHPRHDDVGVYAEQTKGSSRRRSNVQASAFAVLLVTRIKRSPGRRRQPDRLVLAGSNGLVDSARSNSSRKTSTVPSLEPSLTTLLEECMEGDKERARSRRHGRLLVVVAF
jgi:hypothetical protein